MAAALRTSTSSNINFSNNIESQPGIKVRRMTNTITSIYQSSSYKSAFSLQREYMSSIPVKNDYTAVSVVASAAGCSAVGAAIGCAWPAGGQAAGALVGYAIGMAIGGFAIAPYNFAKGFREWVLNSRENCRDNLIKLLTNELEESAEKRDLICSISYEIVVDPVRTPFSPAIYSRQSLEESVKKHGKCPQTNKKMEVKDICVSARGIIGVNYLCKQVLEREITNPRLSSQEQEGLRKMIEDCESNMKNFQEQEEKSLNAMRERKEITLAQYAERLMQLSATIQGSIARYSNPASRSISRSGSSSNLPLPLTITVPNTPMAENKTPE